MAQGETVVATISISKWKMAVAYPFFWVAVAAYGLNIIGWRALNAVTSCVARFVCKVEIKGGGFDGRN